MELTFADDKLEKKYNSQKLLQQDYGPERAERVGRRLGNLRDAPTLEAMRNLPGRCHELKNNLDERLAIDVDGPYRLLFEVANDPIPRKPDGGLDWSRVTGIRILGITNYHE